MAKTKNKSIYPILFKHLELQPPRGFPYDDPNESQLGQLMRWCSWLVSPHQGSFLRRYWLGRFGCSLDYYKSYLVVGGLVDTALPMFVAQLEGEFHCRIDPEMIRTLSLLGCTGDLSDYQGMAGMLRGSLLGHIELQKAEWEREQREKNDEVEKRRKEERKERRRERRAAQRALEQPTDNEPTSTTPTKDENE